MTQLKGTHLTVRFSRVVDGDTIRVFLPGSETDESLRILALDAEESYAGGSKPVTPWGKKAKEFALAFFADASEVIIEFLGNEPIEVCIEKYRGNYGRLLVFVHHNGIDYQEYTIRNGFSPYFMKYGNAVFNDHHRRYTQAEQQAQQKNIGVWDQLSVNQTERRNYAALTTWWKLRARIIDEYRALKVVVPTLLNTRLDYQAIVQKAQNNQTVTIFTELRGIRRITGEHGLISCGSDDRPFSLFIPMMNANAGQEIIQLLMNRYISDGENYARRSYAYVTGELSLFGSRPQMVLTSALQISDDLASRGSDTKNKLQISVLLPDPKKRDVNKETVSIKNLGANDVSIEGWQLQDLAGHIVILSGRIRANSQRKIVLLAHQLILNNTGDELFLFNSEGELQSHVTYTEKEVRPGIEISFES